MRWTFIELSSSVLLHHVFLVDVEWTIRIDRYNHLPNIRVDLALLISETNVKDRISFCLFSFLLFFLISFNIMPQYEQKSPLVQLDDGGWILPPCKQ